MSSDAWVLVALVLAFAGYGVVRLVVNDPPLRRWRRAVVVVEVLVCLTVAGIVTSAILRDG